MHTFSPLMQRGVCKLDTGGIYNIIYTAEIVKWLNKLYNEQGISMSHVMGAKPSRHHTNSDLEILAIICSLTIFSSRFTACEMVNNIGRTQGKIYNIEVCTFLIHDSTQTDMETDYQSL